MSYVVFAFATSKFFCACLFLKYDRGDGDICVWWNWIGMGDSSPPDEAVARTLGYRSAAKAWSFGSWLRLTC